MLSVGQQMSNLPGYNLAMKINKEAAVLEAQRLRNQRRYGLWTAYLAIRRHFKPFALKGKNDVHLLQW